MLEKIADAGCSIMQLDYRYNRVIVGTSRQPWADFGSRGIGSVMHSGYVKCKLAHGLGYSIIVPDLLFLGTAAEQWIQPLAFGPNILTKKTNRVECKFSVDVSCGHRLMVHFTTDDFVTVLSDGAELYRCTFQGAPDLAEYVTGTSSLGSDHAPWIRLYHHTSAGAKSKIEASGELWGSKWNIQGTEKQLTNVAYVYFTPLHEVTHIDDLKLIAMASDGKLSFMVDDFQLPPALLPGWVERYKGLILILPVYRASTADRTATLAFDIDTTLLAPQHVLRHEPPNDFVWYEIATPFVHRIRIKPDSTLKFSLSHCLSRNAVTNAKSFEYVVVGDARSVEGLAAPYDEENTTYILKIERPESGSNILQFWFRFGNQDLYSGKRPELQQFRKRDK